MSDNETCAELPYPPARHRVRTAASTPEPIAAGRLQTEYDAGPGDLDFVICRLGINASESIQRLREAGEEFEWRRWTPFND